MDFRDIETIDVVEETEEIKYPELFRRIYESGSMKWMTSYEWLNNNRDELRCTSDAFMYNISADCEPLLFDDVLQEKEYIDELEEISGYKIKEQYTFIPFAKTGRGDMYCFVYENKKECIHIILYCHDVTDITSYGVDFEEFLTWQLCSTVCDDLYGQEIDENILSHAQFLNDEHKAMFESENMDLIQETKKIIENKMDALDAEDLREKFCYEIN